MNPVQRVFAKAVSAFKLYVLRDPMLVNAKRWFRDMGHGTYRLDYPLNRNSVVLDIGGYVGDFAAAVFDRFGCSILVFEPLGEYHAQCCERFRDNPSVDCYGYGLSSQAGQFEIKKDGRASAFLHNTASRDGLVEIAEVRSITDVFSELGLKEVDLMKINIEGGEYDLLDAIIRSGLIRNVKYLKIQFHDFVEDAARKRDALRERLGKTHREMWCYDFVWESWERL